MKKILVLGSGGLVGYKLCTLFLEKNHSFMSTYNLRNPNFGDDLSSKIDINSFSKIENLIKNFNPDLVFNCISLTNVDSCEKNPSLAFKINSEFTMLLSKLCHSQNSKLIYFSTDSVFDGLKSSPYSENDSPNPINVYGKSKLEGETHVLDYPENLVIRASVLYGWLPLFLANVDSSSMKPNNFVQWLVTSLQNKKQVEIITDELSTPIITEDLVENSLFLSKNHQGLYHLAPDFQLNRYEFSCKIAQNLSMNSELIKPVTNAQLGRNVSTGQNKCLDSSKAKKISGISFLNLNESIEIIKKQMDF